MYKGWFPALLPHQKTLARRLFILDLKGQEVGGCMGSVTSAWTVVVEHLRILKTVLGLGQIHMPLALGLRVTSKEILRAQ